MSNLDLNNFWERTKSQKIYKGNYLCNFIVETIDSSQTIKRLMRYHTDNPMAIISNNKEGIPVEQPDLTVSLCKEFSAEGTKLLYNTSFKDDMEIEQTNYIFVYNPINNFKYLTNDTMAKLKFNIAVLVSDAYNDIHDDDNEIYIKRGIAICATIDDLLDNYTIVDDKYSKLVGNVKFKSESIVETRVAKTSDMIAYVMTYGVESTASRLRVEE